MTQGLRHRRAYQLAEQQDWFCAACNNKMNKINGSKFQATVEHLIPRSFGGDNSSYNLVATCFECNYLRGIMNFPAFCRLRNGERVSFDELFPNGLPIIYRNRSKQVDCYV